MESLYLRFDFKIDEGLAQFVRASRQFCREGHMDDSKVLNNNGGLAQLERLTGSQKVIGSIPIFSTLNVCFSSTLFIVTIKNLNNRASAQVVSLVYLLI